MTYTDQEKTAIIAKYRQGKPIQELCSEYEICARTIYRWAKKYCGIVPGEKRALTVKECDMLLHQVKKLENIVAILKTVNCTAHAPLKEKLHELELLYDQYDVHTLCEALDVSRGTFSGSQPTRPGGLRWETTGQASRCSRTCGTSQ